MRRPSIDRASASKSQVSQKASRMSGVRGFFSVKKFGRPVAWRSNLERLFLIHAGTDAHLQALAERPAAIALDSEARMWRPHFQVVIDHSPTLVLLEYSEHAMAAPEVEQLSRASTG
jgi:hypothetical protein